MARYNDSITSRARRLFDILKSYGSIAVGLSGGVDSTLLLAASKRVLGSRVIALTACSPTHPQRELDMAQHMADELGVRHIRFPSDEMQDSDFTANGPDRCYHCKKRLFTAMRQAALKENIDKLAHGANLDDLADYRPGFRAAQELDVAAPLIEAELSKADIRQLAKDMGLPNWNRPAMACLATRIPYGISISSELLKKIEAAEAVVRQCGIGPCRVRHHGGLARIEIDAARMHLLSDEDIRLKLIREFKSIGYQFVCLDLEGYVSGKMNRQINGL